MRRFMDWLGRKVIPLLFRVEIVDLENLPVSGPVILLVNHINFTDVSILSVLLPRQPVGMAKRELMWHPVLGPIVRTMGVIPVRRGEADREALRLSQKLLVEGKHVLMIAPEGHRSGHGRLQPAHDGIAFIAARAGATIVPVATTGVERFWRSVLRLGRTPVRVAVGRGFRFRSRGGKINRDSLKMMTQEAMYQLALLLPPEYRGTYSEVERSTTDYLDFGAEGGDAEVDPI